MTDTINQDTEQLTETIINPIPLTRNQKRAAIAFGIFTAITGIALIIASIHATDSANAITHTIWTHLMSK